MKLHYRLPFAWQHTLKFLQNRLIPGIEWVADEAYFRTIRYADTKGYFSIENDPVKYCLLLSVSLDDYQHLNPITQRIRALFDVDAPVAKIDSQLSPMLSSKLAYLPGLRIPGIWDSYEAGIRAVLGQQVSVKQAMILVTTLVQELGEDIILDSGLVKKLFPRPEVVSSHSLDFFRMPQSRKDTVRRLSEYFLSADNPDNIDDWLAIKGIGPWTINYVKIRAAKDPDVWLAGDAGINNALKLLDQPLDLDAAKPWRSYLTFQLWNQL